MFSSITSAFVLAVLAATSANAAVSAKPVIPSPDIANVGCFGGGQVGDCSSVINSFCTPDFNNVPGGASVTECFNVNNYHCDFSVKNTASQSQSISTALCEADMLVTNNGCNGHGGIRADGNFQLTVDPNAGSC
ncbi:hypothetical protein GALMADRAFT_250609 [Galerina marginata CBS 339.88]|uniref:Glycan binding protein Y3-like domain-containing protein n=1 Tax=Galerina marginata (strain CBS 339.88) TaxID=685588 RepID=A0A067T1W6_GALM3|nr:hypothetical protein GALMADRAFT_250609 [Galerina marginata CBS 339.88]